MIPRPVPGRRVGIVDYLAGNLRSITNAFEFLGADVVRVHQPAEADHLTHLVLPGVGAFGFCAERLAKSGLMGAIENWAFDLQRPILGICVGMQLLADASEESPTVPGLGWIGGHVRLIPAVDGLVRVPHVGWNTVTFEASCGEYKAGDQADFYFDHSFAFVAPGRGITVASCEHAIRFSAIVRRDNIVAAQFHPEKSQACGIRFLRGFLAG